MNSNGRKISTKAIVMAGLLTALSVVLTRLFSLMIPLTGLPALRIGFGDIPIIIGGMLFGPVIGALTGVVSDLLGYIINPMGGFFIGFTLSAALRGIIPGIIYAIIKSKRLHIYNNSSVYSSGTIFFTVAISHLIISIGLNTLWLSIMFNKGFIIFLPGRLLSAVVMIPLHSLVILILSRLFKHMNI